MPSKKNSPGGLSIFVLTIFLSAFLLFQVQPIIARYILPWYGGSPSVWSTCMLFFQVGLVAGYAYAHLLVTILGERRHIQIAIHFLLIAVAILTLPITPDPGMKPGVDDTQPVLGIVKLLATSVGLPFIILSASGPLVQHWFSKIYPDRSPFRLYAISNVGSLLALLSYPFLVEVYLTGSRQSLLWSLGFGFYSLALLVTSFLYAKSKQPRTRSAQKEEAPLLPASGKPHYLRWILFSACGSLLLLSVTNQICQDVAVVPFFWTIPLSLYLLSFIIAFDHSRWYSRLITLPIAAVSVGIVISLLNGNTMTEDWPYLYQVIAYCSALFFTCLICHGEIIRLKPPPQFLTAFYLAISIGGALGGIFVNLVAPVIFDSYHELRLGLLLLAILITWQLYPSFHTARKASPTDGQLRSRTAKAALWTITLLWFAGIFFLISSHYTHLKEENESVISSSRGFFGILKVKEDRAETGEVYRTLVHGQIHHGLQFLDPKLRLKPTTYFAKKTGIGATFEFIPQRTGPEQESLQVGIIGLGVGTLAAYALPGDYFRFYEINPDVIELSQTDFTYLEDCQGDLSVILGDGRISLEQELAEGRKNYFDILAVDAFSGDSIPMHLLTKEAFTLYNEHLKEEGVLALNITNKHLDLSDPIRNVAKQFGWNALRLSSPSDGGLAFSADWVVLTKNKNLSKALLDNGRIYRWLRKDPREIHWTDDFHNLLETLD